MALCNDADVQIHLPVDKLNVEEVPDDKERAYEDAERIVRGYLAGVVDAAELATWDIGTPNTVPDIIRAIAGRLAAAEIYRVRYSEASLEDPMRGQVLYQQAMDMLNNIISGAIVLPGVDPGTQFDNTYFFPNDGETDTPKFTMADRY